jgi:hypothetical protein
LAYCSLPQVIMMMENMVCHPIVPDVINVIKMPSFQYFLYLLEQKKVSGAKIQGVPAQLFVY